MKTTKLLVSLLACFALSAGLAFAGDGADKDKEAKKARCCMKAEKEGKTCDHECCVSAAKESKSCEKCSAPKKKDS